MIEVKDVMTRDVVSVPAGMSLKEAGRLLVGDRISGVPVVDAERHVLGVFSGTDLLPKEVAPVPLLPRGRNAYTAEEERSKLEAVVVGEAMSAPAVTVEPHRPVSTAARLMLEHGITRLPVVEGGELVGIVTRTDLVRAFVRTDAEVAQDVEEEVARLLLGENGVAVEVDGGAVTLQGPVDGRPDAELLELLVSRVPGVVSVTANLSWSDADPEL